MMTNNLIDDVTERLRSQGGRMTAQRRMILEALGCLGCHPTAEEIFAVVNRRDPSIHLSTVYRTLRWLEAEGLVSGRRFEDGVRTERFDPVLPNEHHHFICDLCKTVIEFEHPVIETIKQDIARQYGARVGSASMLLHGICAACQKENQ
ncbi:MAG: Fur family transcriptional regulator [Chloroflexota bacterium]